MRERGRGRDIEREREKEREREREIERERERERDKIERNVWYSERTTLSREYIDMVVCRCYKNHPTLSFSFKSKQCE